MNERLVRFLYSIQKKSLCKPILKTSRIIYLGNFNKPENELSYERKNKRSVWEAEIYRLH